MSTSSGHEHDHEYASAAARAADSASAHATASESQRASHDAATAHATTPHAATAPTASALELDLALERGRFELCADDLRADELARLVAHRACGALATFSGTARDHSRGRAVVRLEYEAYAAMVDAEMARIFAECRAAHGVGDAEHARLPEQHLRMYVRHRIGVVPIGVSAVAIAVAAPHRERAFGACRFLIDTLKARVPIWKKEIYADGSSWIGERP